MFARRILGLVAAMVGMVMMFSVVSHLAAQDKKDDVSGTWKWTADFGGQQQETTLTLKQDGDKVTGTVSGFQGDQPISDGTYKNGDLSFKVVNDFNGRKFVTNYTAKVSGDSLKGKSQVVIENDIDGKRSK